VEENKFIMASYIPHSRPCLTELDHEAIVSVLKTGMIAEGPLVAEFEQAVAQYTGFKASVAMSSGTAALYLTLLALGIGEGDEIILPTYVCQNVYDAVVAAGSTPVLCDIGEAWYLRADSVRHLITAKTKGIILVHIFGIQADAEEIFGLGIPVIENCCQSFRPKEIGTEIKYARRVSFVSFHATKLLTTGEGGMVLSDDINFIERIRALKGGGNVAVAKRFSCPLTDLQAALGLSQLSQYDWFLERRKEIAARYFQALGDCPVRLPHHVRSRSIFFRFPVRIRDDFEVTRKRFEELGIHVRRGVDSLLHRVFGWDKTSFPIAEKIFQETVSIPIYPALTEDEVESVIAACKQIWNCQ
jgi:UDP-4-amino-4-deoxy-L-arabinose-oxoglutarate aminotransferase